MSTRIKLVMLLVMTGGCAARAELQVSTAGTQQTQSAGETEQARDAFEHALLRNPNDASAREGMSATSERLSLDERAAGHMDAALATLLRARKLEPEDKRVLLDLGILEEEMDLHLDADATLKALEALPPLDPNTHYAEARVDMSLGRLKEAEDEMQQYLKAQPMDPSAHFGLGRIYLLGLQFEKADVELERSIALQPKQTEAYYQLGQSKLSQNKFVEAIGLFDKALERSPEHGGALAGMGIAYFRLKEYAKAKEWLGKATQVAPEYQPGHYYLGLTMARLGDTAGSRRELDLATSLADRDSKQAATRLRLNQGDRP
jgi:tetratricopeptide (TPR) repeat protein